MGMGRSCGRSPGGTPQRWGPFAVVTVVVHPLAAVVWQVADVEAVALLAWIPGTDRALVQDRVIVATPARIGIVVPAVIAGCLHPLATRGVRALHVGWVGAVRDLTQSALQVITRRVACPAGRCLQRRVRMISTLGWPFPGPAVAALGRGVVRHAPHGGLDVALAVRQRPAHARRVV